MAATGMLAGWPLLLGQTAPSAPPPGDDEVATAFVARMQAGRLDCPLEILANIPELWRLTPDGLDAAFTVPKGVVVEKPPFFQWMTTSRSRAVFMKQPFTNLRLDLTLFGGALPVDEAVVDFLDGKLTGITVSLYNRGDSEAISREEFQRRVQLCGKKLGERLQVRPAARKPEPTQGLLAEGWTWIGPRGMAALEYNPEANQGKVEFLRLKLAPCSAQGIIATAIQGHDTVLKLSALPKNLTKTENGDVFIRGIPMVDQGPKGYCVVASAQRIFEYFGISADQHQIAQSAGSDAKAGTDILMMAKILGKIDFRFKTRFKILGMNDGTQFAEVDERTMTSGRQLSEDQFALRIHRYIGEGIPLLWALTLGKFPEEPSIALQSDGLHMRLIIGFNDTTRHLLFSDSWGAGHELKRMALGDAYHASCGLFVMSPTVR